MPLADKNHKTEGLGDSSVGKGLAMQMLSLEFESSEQNRNKARSGIMHEDGGREISRSLCAS